VKEIVLYIPTLDVEQNVEIDVKINGRKKTIKYRVEIIDWEAADPDTGEKVEVLKRVIREHDRDWELVQIGAPTESNIPVMFRKLEGV